MNDWFIIKDLEDFTHKARSIVYNHFGQWDEKSEIDVLIDETAEENQDDLDSILSQQESLVIVKNVAKKQKHKLTQDIRYVINDELFAAIIHDLNSRMVSNIINSLVKKGFVESAFDSTVNDFVFWVKENDNEKTQEEKPETD